MLNIVKNVNEKNMDDIQGVYIIDREGVPILTIEFHRLGDQNEDYMLLSNFLSAFQSQPSSFFFDKFNSKRHAHKSTMAIIRNNIPDSQQDSLTTLTP